MQRTIILKNTESGQELTLPVTPEQYPVAAGRAVERIDMAVTGQVALPGLKGLFSEQLQFMLPAQLYPFCTAGAVADPKYYIDLLTQWSNNADVCRYIVVGAGVNAAVLLGEISYREEDGSNDVYGSAIARWRSQDFTEVFMKRKRILCMILTLAAAFAMLCVPAFAAGGSGDVSGAVEQTWTAAAAQLKTIVNNVVFPALDMILAIAFFIKVGSAYFDYRKHGQFEWAAPAILLACLIFTLTAPSYIWGIIGQ